MQCWSPRWLERRFEIDFTRRQRAGRLPRGHAPGGGSGGCSTQRRVGRLPLRHALQVAPAGWATIPRTRSLLLDSFSTCSPDGGSGLGCFLVDTLMPRQLGDFLFDIPSRRRQRVRRLPRGHARGSSISSSTCSLGGGSGLGDFLLDSLQAAAVSWATSSSACSPGGGSGLGDCLVDTRAAHRFPFRHIL